MHIKLLVSGLSNNTRAGFATDWTGTIPVAKKTMPNVPNPVLIAGGKPLASENSAVYSKGSFTPNDSVIVSVTLTGGAFDLFHGHCNDRIGCMPILAVNVTFVCNDGDGDGVTRCGWTLR